MRTTRSTRSTEYLKRVKSSYLSINKVFKILRGRKYSLGGNGKKMGRPLDCWGLFVEYCNLRYGLNILGYENEFPLMSNYKKEYELNPKKVINEFKLFLENKFCIISISRMMSGDVLYVTIEEEKEKTDVIGIYGGNGAFLITSPDSGSTIVNLSYYNLESAYRWQQ